MDANLRALENRQPAGEALRRYTEVARLVTGNKGAAARDGVEWTRKLVADLQIPRLSSHGLTGKDIAEVVEKAEKASSMKANPIALTREELAGILERAL
jgi:alcohol dehydrogenase class IV